MRRCHFLEPVGNMREGRPLSELWNAGATQRRRHDMSWCTRPGNPTNGNFGAGA